MDMSVFLIIGCILSHGYLVAGILPTRIALPTLMCMLLGAATTVATDFLLDTFLDFISASKRQMFIFHLIRKRLSLPIYKSLWALLPCLAAINYPHPPTLWMSLSRLLITSLLSNLLLMCHWSTLNCRHWHWKRIFMAHGCWRPGRQLEQFMIFSYDLIDSSISILIFHYII